MAARDLLDEPPAPPRRHPLLDAGAGAVALLTSALFVAPMVVWARAGTGPGAQGAFETRMLLASALLALALPLAQIARQIRQSGGAAVRGNRARFRGDEGAAGRLGRAHRNLIESLVPFAAAVLAARGWGVSTPWTVAASGMFLAARLTHALTYALGLTVIRSAAYYAGLIATAVVIAQVLLRP